MATLATGETEGANEVLPCDLQVVVVVRNPKTAKASGRIQHVIIYDVMTLRLCRLAFQRSPPTSRLCPGSVRDLEAWFTWGMIRLGLSPARFTPGGMRAGGATHQYLQGTSLERVMWRGRWDAITTLRHYIQEASSVLALGDLPEQVTAQMLHLTQRLADVLSALNESWPEMERMVSWR